jgi:hypothetical protein
MESDDEAPQIVRQPCETRVEELLVAGLLGE